jgi:hypothetical protein
MLYVVIAGCIIQPRLSVILHSASLRWGAVEIVEAMSVAIGSQEIQPMVTPLGEGHLQGVVVGKSNVLSLVQKTYVRKLAI